MSPVDVADWEPADEEPLGTKPKQWLRAPDGALWLWKESELQHDARHGVFRKGDDWSEVVAGRVGRALGVPVADVKLARQGERYGVVSRSVLFLDGDVLAHGNELLAELGVVSGGPRDRSGYTVAAVAEVLDGVEPPAPHASLVRAFDWFTGYVVLDALVGNTDRHQDNWATIRSPAGHRLAPSFDHASCLAFQLSDVERSERLATTDARRSIEAYAAAARTKFEDHPTPRDAVTQALEMCSDAVRSHYSAVVDEAPPLSDVLAEVPTDRMSELARRFAGQLYEVNRKALSHLLRTMHA